MKISLYPKTAPWCRVGIIHPVSIILTLTPLPFQLFFCNWSAVVIYERLGDSWHLHPQPKEQTYFQSTCLNFVHHVQASLWSWWVFATFYCTSNEGWMDNSTKCDPNPPSSLRWRPINQAVLLQSTCHLWLANNYIKCVCHALYLVFK